MAEPWKSANWAVRWLPIYHPCIFSCFILHWVADKEREGETGCQFIAEQQKKTIHNHIYAYCQLRGATSSIPQMHVFGLWEEAENPQTTHVGRVEKMNQYKNVPAPKGFKSRMQWGKSIN